MFKRKYDEDLWQLQQELIAVEEDEEDEIYDEEDYEEDWEDDEEEETEEFGLTDYVNSYKRGKPKKFTDKTFFERDIYDDDDVLYRKDYKKAKRKKRRKALGLMILAILELVAIGAAILWFMSWIQ